jgi:hypothetical protein
MRGTLHANTYMKILKTYWDNVYYNAVNTLPYYTYKRPVGTLRSSIPRMLHEY